MSHFRGRGSSRGTRGVKHYRNERVMPTENLQRTKLGSQTRIFESEFVSETSHRGEPRFQRARGRGRGGNRYNENKEEKSSSQNFTCWSYYHVGEVEIPEICVFSIDNRCRYQNTGCQRLHAKCANQWQFLDTNTWCNFRNFHSKEIEDAYENVENDSVMLTPMDPRVIGSSAQEAFKVFGTSKWEVDFESMTVQQVTGTVKISKEVRRISTQSSAISNSAKATVYEWFFLDEGGKWIEYGEEDSLGKTDFVSPLTSLQLELNYNSNTEAIVPFSNSKFDYEINFKTMKQINLSTKKERSVRRRPKNHVGSKAKTMRPKVQRENSESLPSHWDTMAEDDGMIQVTLDSSSAEYQEISQLVRLTLPSNTIYEIRRIQNPFLFRPFKNKQKELILKYGTAEKLNIQKLFHGTRTEHVVTICKENFDWRLHGTNAGQAYGRGTYFSNSAAHSCGYSKMDDLKNHRFLIVAEVIVGYVTKGDPSMTRPPKNSATNELFDTTVDNVSAPTRFVKYDKQEYYPAYVIKMS